MAGGIGSQEVSNERLNITFHPVAGARNYRPPIGATQTPRAASGPLVAFEKEKRSGHFFMAAFRPSGR
jgi:hypothetical protein